jgi:hypothetical protein
MAKDAESAKRSVYGVMGFAFLVGGLTFGYYVWSGTVIRDGGSNTQQEPVRNYAPRLTLSAFLAVERQGTASTIASIKLTNTAPVRVLMPDTVALEPLFSISVRYGDAKGSPMNGLTRRGNVPSFNGIPVQFDESRDAAVELVPGSSIVKTIPLSQLFDLQKPGHYEVVVQYQPMNIVGANGASLPSFNVNGASCGASFDVPPQPEADISSVK